jgi:leucyl-tRNA synthetase
MIHCPGCGVVPVPEADLPIVLPEDANAKGSVFGGRVLALIDKALEGEVALKPEWLRAL